MTQPPRLHHPDSCGHCHPGHLLDPHQRSQIGVSGLMASRSCSRMHLSAAIAALLLLFSSAVAQSSSGDTFYLLTVTSKAVGGTNETLCVTINSPRLVSLTVDFQLNGSSVNVLKERLVLREFYRCGTFQVPVVNKETIASINIKINGSKNEEKSTQILISPSSKLILIETDKPIYKPGQKVNFRIVSLDTALNTYNRNFSTIELRDPNSNRIGQWLNVSTSSGMADLSFPLNSRAVNGLYIITVWKNDIEQITEQFEVKDYVLPTFDVKVELPPMITILDTSVKLKVCAKYIYGKPVTGEVKVVVCHRSWSYYWYYRRPPSDTSSTDLCHNYTMQTDKTGCGQKDLNLTHFAIADMRYQMLLDVQSEVKENGTGVVMKGSGSVSISNMIAQLLFEDSPVSFRPGMTYEGKVKMIDASSNPMKNRTVYLNGGTNLTQKLTTDNNGVAQFSYDTKKWSQDGVTIMARFNETEQPYEYKANLHTAYYNPAYLWLQPFYSKSKSYITIEPNSTLLSCEETGSVVVDYVINDQFRSTFYFFYMVLSRGHLVSQGRLSVNVKQKQTVIKSTLSIPLTNIDKLSPYAQVVVYALLSGGEAVADSMNFPVQPCLTNKVSLNFESSPELPGAQTSLNLKAAPNSLCSVRALDKSLLLLQPESELTIQSVFNMLPVQMLWGYPYQVYEYETNPCWVKPIRFEERVERSIRYYPYYEKTNVYSIFRAIGVKILTNSETKPVPICRTNLLMKPGVEIESTSIREGPSSEVIRVPGTSDEKRVPSPKPPIITVRKYFPETWIWDLVRVGGSGQQVLKKKVPDSITTWQADAFCTSPVGFGIAPKAELVSLQPFFVSVTMPSSVIRGEVFTLKATVFNYLKSCITVNVVLGDYKNFSAQKCNDCKYSHCLCADESLTVSWTVTPLVLGNIRINVTAEGSKFPNLCGSRAGTVPTRGRVDTVIKSLLVEAEGTKQYKSYNELLCPSDNTVKKTVSLTLPSVFVEDSAEASVSVIGDLMGRALQNLARLLVMPYGCGEQNMVRFAPNIYILQYLESTNQLTPEIMSLAQTYLITGYQNELRYKHDDGSYSSSGRSQPSGYTWLTAFVMKCFGGAMRYIFVDQVFVDQAKTWLGQQQQSNGCFASVGRLSGSYLTGGVRDEVTLTAYITAAMLELNYTVEDPVVENGLTYLRNEYSQVNSTYAKALLFYTFTLAGNQAMRLSLMSALDAEAIVAGGGRHWSRTNDRSLPNSVEVETTSYVLLALMSGPPLPGFGIGYSTSIVHWLAQQQNAFGGFTSTQDTVVALQALAKYSQATYSPAGNVMVTVTSPSKVSYTFTINQSNRLLYQEKQLQEVPGTYRVQAEGKGCVYVQFALSYNIPPPSQNGSAFGISASASGNCRVPDGALTLTVTIDLVYKGTRPETNMVVIEVRPLSGFEADTTSVVLVNSDPNSSEGAVQIVEISDGILVIYLDILKKGQEKQYTLTITAVNNVDHNKPAVVKVYDYYETGDFAVTSYTSPCPYQ